MRLKNLLKNRNGDSLVEIVVSLVILILLTTIAVHVFRVSQNLFIRGNSFKTGGEEAAKAAEAGNAPKSETLRDMKVIVDGETVTLPVTEYEYGNDVIVRTIGNGQGTGNNSTGLAGIERSADNIYGNCIQMIEDVDEAGSIEGCIEKIKADWEAEGKDTKHAPLFSYKWQKGHSATDLMASVYYRYYSTGWPVIKDDNLFARYDMECSSLFIRPVFYMGSGGGTSVLIVASGESGTKISSDTGTGTAFETGAGVYMIYDPADRVWYREPKTSSNGELFQTVAEGTQFISGTAEEGMDGELLKYYILKNRHNSFSIESAENLLDAVIEEESGWLIMDDYDNVDEEDGS